MEKNLNDYNLNWNLGKEMAKDREHWKNYHKKMFFLRKTCLTQSKSKNYSVMIIARPSIVLTFNFRRSGSLSWYDISM